MQRLVRITWHAVERFSLRFPEFVGADEAATRRFIAGDVADAIASCRMAARVPRFAVQRGMRRIARRKRNRERWRSVRYVWSADETRLYVIDRTNSVTTVLTAMKPGADDTEADVDAAA